MKLLKELNRNPMHKYYVGIGAFLGLMLILVLLAGYADRLKRADVVTKNRLLSVGGLVQNYANDHRTLPNSLADLAKGSETQGVTYKKISTRVYELCAHFNRDYGTSRGYYDDVAANQAYSGSELVNAFRLEQQNHPGVNHVLIQYDSWGYIGNYKMGENCFVSLNNNIPAISADKSGAQIFTTTPAILQD